MPLQGRRGTWECIWPKSKLTHPGSGALEENRAAWLLAGRDRWPGSQVCLGVSVQGELGAVAGREFKFKLLWPVACSRSSCGEVSKDCQKGVPHFLFTLSLLWAGGKGTGSETGHVLP